jgi:HK97 family phage major capsid protein
MAVAEELAFAIDDAIIRGTGAGSPLGVLNAPCLVTQTKEVSQVADTIVYENVSKMRTRMTPRMYAGANWYVNSECMPQIEQLKILVKNVAGTENVGGMPVFVNANASNTPYGTLFGRPIVPVEQCSAIGDLGDILLFNPKYYYMSQKGGVQTASSIHVNFLTDEQVFRFIYRTDGRLPFKSAITPYKGAATLSPVVALEAR